MFSRKGTPPLGTPPLQKVAPLLSTLSHKVGLEGRSAQFFGWSNPKELVRKMGSFTPRIQHRVRIPKGNKRVCTFYILKAHPMTVDSTLAIGLPDEE